MKYRVYAFVANPFKQESEYREVFTTVDYKDIYTYMQEFWSGYSYKIIFNKEVIKYHFE